MPHAIVANNKRITGIDALRGLAVLLMLTQHIIYWVCSELSTSLSVQVFGALGGIAAPLFIVLAGTGAALAKRNRTDIDRMLAGRGIVIIGYGYVLNLLTPNWFAPESWYVLHMIGLSLLLAPVFRKLPETVAGALLVAVIIITAMLQSLLETPLFLNNWQMASTSLPGGTLRLVLVEGFFPVFPWIAFFLAGFLAGRLNKLEKTGQWEKTGQGKETGPEKEKEIGGRPRRRQGHLWKMAALFLGISITLSGVYIAGFGFAASDPWLRLFRPIPNFYPALAPVTFFLIAAALFLLSVFLWLQKHPEGSGPPGPRSAFGVSRFMAILACPGRCSLTILMVHIPLIREPVVRLGYWRSLDVFETLVLTLFFLVAFSLAAVWWRKIDFRYGAEWLLRKAFP